ncbi:hypothetical protein Ddye_014409 [Dipteronia dyeriana]|uniref:Uncharacterized protein n=1 Tax=Dipteronia dyeriana TaxID=168575 RepID=A0AAE0CL51_9ROSI|nr:hypothetical protein Ddye_014409 [Dipteronia dyeriana]
MKGKSELFDLEKHLAFYEAYHSNTVNKFIHIFSVWPMFFAFLVLFYFVPPVYDLSDKMMFSSSGLVLNFGFLFAMIHALLYICLDKKAGSLAALLCITCWVGACALATRLSFSLAWKAVLAFQLFCFGTQALGHAIWEKRAPAEDLVLAIAMAPFCVFLEVLQTVFGYEPYPGFHASVQANIEVEIKNWQNKNQKKIS